jgi:pimeloyl-ACP methyl ester carboxylesterase
VKRLVASLGIAALLVGSALAPAAAEPEHTRPQGPAKVAFGPGFPHLLDHEWNFALGGFGGFGPHAPRKHFPVIFVHGNNVDAADWYVVRDDFRAAGWTDQEMYALSYNGLGGENGSATMRMQPERDQEHVDMGWDANTRITNNTVNVPDLYDFIRAVQAYTGSEKFSLVSHSLGVTLARKVLKDHPELRADVVAFVGIAGGNHGTSFCPPGSEDQLVSCNEIAAGTQWLADLNGPDGADETFAGPKWLTVYDGSGAGDPAYAGPDYATSPMLRGALNRTYPGTDHNDLRIDPAIVADYRSFLEAADATARGLPAPAPPRILARTG